MAEKRQYNINREKNYLMIDFDHQKNNHLIFDISDTKCGKVREASNNLGAIYGIIVVQNWLIILNNNIHSSKFRLFCKFD